MRFILYIGYAFIFMLGMVYTYSLFYAKPDELEADAYDCFVTFVLLLVGYGMLYLIYWSMRSIMPDIVTPLVYFCIYFVFLFIAFYIRCFAAIQDEWGDGKVHFKHKKKGKEDVCNI